jgi:signal transduction histidine kinase
MSHELRTPMHAILGFAEMGQNRVERVAADKLRHYFERIHSSGTRLLTLLNDLLDLSKMEVGKMIYTMAPCDVGQVAREAVDELRGMAQRHDVYLQLVVHGNAPLYAEIDAFRIGQLLRNLLSNAIKFTPAGAPVQIDLAIDTAANLCLSVRDFGPGVPAAEQEQIFNTFIQSSLTKTGAGGTGLGWRSAANRARPPRPHRDPAGCRPRRPFPRHPAARQRWRQRESVMKNACYWSTTNRST